VSAISHGLSRFFTGKPCKRHHVAERFVIGGDCVLCRPIRAAEWEEQNPGARRANLKNWQKAFPERQLQATLRWREANRDKVLATSAAYKVANAESIAAKKYTRCRTNEYRIMNRDAQRVRRANTEKRENDKLVLRNWRSRPEVAEHLRKAASVWQKNNPDKVRTINRNSKARRKKAEGRHTAQDIANIYQLQRGKCAICKSALNGKYHVDHIVALKNGGSNWPRNLQCLCPPCNLRKSDKHPVVFAQERGLLL
jgi:5-methylcytosine-specific restriction endonuclease McrA